MELTHHFHGMISSPWPYRQTGVFDVGAVKCEREQGPAHRRTGPRPLAPYLRVFRDLLMCKHRRRAQQHILLSLSVMEVYNEQVMAPLGVGTPWKSPALAFEI